MLILYDADESVWISNIPTILAEYWISYMYPVVSTLEKMTSGELI